MEKLKIIICIPYILIRLLLCRSSHKRKHIMLLSGGRLSVTDMRCSDGVVRDQINAYNVCRNNDNEGRNILAESSISYEYEYRR